MSNRRNYGGNYGGGSSYGNGGGGGYGGGTGGRFSSVNPWQSGTSPGRSGALLNQNFLNQLSSPDSQIALATKILTSLLPSQQGDTGLQGGPPSLMSLGGGFGGSRFGGSGYGGGDRYRRDERRSDNFRNRRAANDRNRDRKGADNARTERPKKTDEDVEAADGESKEKGENNGEEEEMVEGAEGNKEPEGPLPGYEDIPTKLFNCHVCGKTMWNDVSFDTHVKGRNHRTKVRDLEESYQVQTDYMRQIAAISLKLVELRRGGKRRPYPSQYCKMCDLQFNGMTMFAHRSTDEHQTLKRFIHPSCDLCNVDFQVRVEYDEHILTPVHLQAVTKSLLRKEKFEKDPNFAVMREQEIKLRLVLDEISNVGGNLPELSEGDKKLIADLLDGETAPPAYDPEGETTVARHQVEPVTGFMCKVCRVYLISEDVVDIHCRTQKHYEAYVGQLKAEATKRNKEKEANEKRKTDTEEESGSAKRRKSDSEEGLNGDKGDSESQDQPADEATKTEETEEKMEVESEQETPPKRAAAAKSSPVRRGRGRGRK